MIDYATAEEKCRSRMLLHYFGEKNEHNCGQCDACLKKHESGIKLGDFQELKEQPQTLVLECLRAFSYAQSYREYHRRNARGEADLPYRDRLFEQIIAP